MVFWMLLVAFDDLVRPDDGGRLPGAVKDFEAPRACQPRLEWNGGKGGGKRGGKLIYVMTSGIFHPENWGKIKRKAKFLWSQLAGLKTKIQRRAGGGGGSISRVGTSA